MHGCQTAVCKTMTLVGQLLEPVQCTAKIPRAHVWKWSPKQYHASVLMHEHEIFHTKDKFLIRSQQTLSGDATSSSYDCCRRIQIFDRM